MIQLFLKECPAMAAPAQPAKISARRAAIDLHTKVAANSTLESRTKSSLIQTLNLCTLYRQNT
jgi:hypothetical protein